MTEYATLGALHTLIEQLDEDDETIPFPHKHTMLQQVASGVDALVSEKLVHRDLATRNVLVFGFDADDVSSTLVKVSDFGLRVNGYTAGQAYVQTEQEKPLRYLAPESIKKGTYSEKTDAWSFGVMVRPPALPPRAAQPLASAPCIWSSVRLRVALRPPASFSARQSSFLGHHIKKNQLR